MSELDNVLIMAHLINIISNKYIHDLQTNRNWLFFY